jgi:hypothetical protein
MEAIFKKYEDAGTDKNTTHSYLDAYERAFESKRQEPVRLLEIGVFSGGSLCAWGDYFSHPESEIVGLDITTVHLRFDLSNPKLKMMILNATKAEDVANIEGDFDFIIDDGSHILRDQVVSFKLLNSRIRTGGAYIIEDIQSIDDAQVLLTMGEMAGWDAELVDTRQKKGRYDDIMIIYTLKMK